MNDAVKEILKLTDEERYELVDQFLRTHSIRTMYRMNLTHISYKDIKTGKHLTQRISTFLINMVVFCNYHYNHSTKKLFPKQNIKKDISNLDDQEYKYLFLNDN